MTTPFPDHSIRRQEDGYIALWLFVVAFMVGLMVVLGGVTRLTESGLSMVHWRPFTGWFPPLSETEWMATFDAYRAYPEYRMVNAGMSLDDFKGIFWLEYLHRLWGRVIGLAFFLPLVFFLIKGWARGRLALHLIGLFVLGGLQGVMGWYMVKSGLVDQPDVSQYRLAAHLGLAFLIAGLLVWTGLAVRDGRYVSKQKSKLSGPVFQALALALLVFITVLSGALVAGLNAGHIFNTFPLMEGQLPPPGYLSMSPVWLNFFEDHASVQFHHRVLALFSFAMIGLYCWRYRHETSWKKPRLLLLAGIVLQVSLGISTLVLVVPIGLAAAHQAGALVVFIILVVTAWQAQKATVVEVSPVHHKPETKPV